MKLPDGKILIPGVIDTVTTFVEHPELVAERIVRYAKLVGRENVIAAPDCGFGTFVRLGAASASGNSCGRSSARWRRAPGSLPANSGNRARARPPSKMPTEGISRRRLLGLAALGVPALVAAQPANQRKGKIDVHHHVGPPPGGRSGEVRNGRPKSPSRRWTATAWRPESAFQDRSRFQPAAQRGRKLAREYNDYGARIGADHPGRFGLFAALPLHDLEGSLKEIEYALDVLKADGFGISTSYGDMWLGDPSLRPVFEELNRRKAVVYVHPNDAPCCTPSTLTYETRPISGAWIEWPMNTARTILSLMVNGNLRQFPDVRFIFSHGAEQRHSVKPHCGFTSTGVRGTERLREMFPDGSRPSFANCTLK